MRRYARDELCASRHADRSNAAPPSRAQLCLGLDEICAQGPDTFNEDSALGQAIRGAVDVRLAVEWPDGWRRLCRARGDEAGGVGWMYQEEPLLDLGKQELGNAGAGALGGADACSCL